MDSRNHKHVFAHIAAQATGIAVALDERDRATHEHCSRVAGLSLELGAACGLSESELLRLQIVAGFHDVGKIGIPDRVLRKLTPYNDDDWILMKEHSTRGERIVRAAALEDGETIAQAVRHHHERYDGAGYPDGLKGERIPILSRIVTVIDSYDAMARMRLYRSGRSHSDIMLELKRHSGRQFDQYVIEKFEAIIENSSFKAV